MSPKYRRKHQSKGLLLVKMSTQEVLFQGKIPSNENGLVLKMSLNKFHFIVNLLLVPAKIS